VQVVHKALQVLDIVVIMEMHLVFFVLSQQVVVKVKDLETIVILEALEDLEVVEEEETELQQEDQLFQEDLVTHLQQTHHKVTMVEMVLELVLQTLEAAVEVLEQQGETLLELIMEELGVLE
tara:strand:+ start:302 stop:667 length:366 start_codon:yes stop_codon:yes gene_type:complete